MVNVRGIVIFAEGWTIIIECLTMLAIHSELKLNEATSNGVVISPPPISGTVNVRGIVIFARGRIECSNRMFNGF